MRQNLNVNGKRKVSVSSVFVAGVYFYQISSPADYWTLWEFLSDPLSHCSSSDLLIQTQTSFTSFPATETQETLQTPAMSVV